MASVNKWIGIGNLGKDPETRYAPSGDAICNIQIACTESWKDKNTGEKKEATEWVRIVFYGRLAEIAGQYLRKGSQVYIEGSIRTRKWQDQSGQDRYTTEIRADEMKMLGSRADSAGQGAAHQPQRPPAAYTPPPAAQGAGGFGDFPDDGIPF